MPKITVSFKHNKEDLELYNEIMKHSDRSAYIKDIMKGHAVKTEKVEDDDMVVQFKKFSI